MHVVMFSFSLERLKGLPCRSFFILDSFAEKFEDGDDSVIGRCDVRGEELGNDTELDGVRVWGLGDEGEGSLSSSACPSRNTFCLAACGLCDLGKS